MSGTPPPQDPLEGFRAAFWQDVRSGAKRSLVEYLTRFPGDEVGVAREYAAIHDAWAEGKETAAGDPTTPDRVRTPGRRNSRIDGLLEEGVLGPYRLERRLGRGGQGIVYLAEDQRLRRKVALKVIPMMETADFDLLRREAEIAARIEHPGICPIYQVGRDRGVAWFAMRYIPGESLAARLEARRGGAAAGADSTFTLDVEGGGAKHAGSEPAPARVPRLPAAPEIGPVLDLLAQVARIVHSAHEEGIIHRDLKPGNIMIAPDGAPPGESAGPADAGGAPASGDGRLFRRGERPVVLDFGLARDENDGRTTLAVSGQPLGTRPYMSPEQVLGRRSEFGRATDVWSLGITLFECLTLRWPFAEAPGTSLYEAILNHAVPDPRPWNGAVPPDVVEVLRVALAKPAGARYPTALGFAEDLERARSRRRVLGTTASLPLVRLDPPPDGGALDAPPAGDEGVRIGNYRLRKELGRGDLGVVHLAWDTHLGRNVALKVFRLDPADWQRKLQHARHEAEVTARLESPAICAIYDTGVEGDTSYIAMRYVEGASLAQEIARASGAASGRSLLPLREARAGGPEGAAALAAVCRWFAAVARVLHQVHEAGIVHRDIKPGNLMVTPELEPVLLGLGFADADTPYATKLFSRDVLPGTPAYMSPEKIRTCAEDRRGDVWSLGATIWESLALRPAFTGATWKEVFEHVLVRPPADLRTLCGVLPPDLLRAIDRALAKDAGRRHATALDLAAELQGVASRAAPEGP